MNAKLKFQLNKMGKEMKNQTDFPGCFNFFYL